MAAKVSDDSCAAWFTSLGQRILAQLDFIPEDRRPTPPVDSPSWETFLTAVAKEAVMAGRKVVIALDEIGAMPTDWATGFFSIIRSIYTTRQNCPHWRHLTFVISGAFNPRDLIKDKTVSNFNIDQRILLRDFDELQIRSLVELIGLSDGETGAAARRIHYWADGQPYLSQYLCTALAACRAAGGVEPIDAIVDQAVDIFFHEDTSHLTRIMELVDDPDLLAYARKITGHAPARFSPGLNDKQFRLAHILGVIKADSQGRCRIRNRIYERALDELWGTVDGVGCRTPSSHGVLPLHQGDRNRLERLEAQQCTGERPESRVPSHHTIFVSYSHKDAKYKEEEVREQGYIAKQRTRFEQAIFRVQSYAFSQRMQPPDCFISYAWGKAEHERWVEKLLAPDLQKAGINVILDRWHNGIGSNISRFVDRIEKCNRVIVVGTPLYRKKYENKVSNTGSVVAAEVDRIGLRMLGTEEQKRTVLPILLHGEEEESFPPAMRGRVFADFRDEHAYFITAFDLVLSLYGIPFNAEAVSDLRESLRDPHMG